MVRYQGRYHTNEKNVLLNPFQELDNQEDRTIFPSSTAYWVNKKAHFIREAKKTII
jgi:hypothetical protein